VVESTDSAEGIGEVVGDFPGKLVSGKEVGTPVVEPPL